jgi:hypothetical protein
VPKGLRGFQPGRRKTGGRVLGEPTKAHLTTAFRDRLKFYGFNFDRQFAQCLKKMCLGQPTPQYSELRALLPYAYPKLKEIDPPAPTISGRAQAPITDAELLEAMRSHERKDDAPRTSGAGAASEPVMDQGPVDVQAQTDPEGAVPSVAGEQGPQ